MIDNVKDNLELIKRLSIIESLIDWEHECIIEYINIVMEVMICLMSNSNNNININMIYKMIELEGLLKKSINELQGNI